MIVDHDEINALKQAATAEPQSTTPAAQPVAPDAPATPPPISKQQSAAPAPAISPDLKRILKIRVPAIVRLAQRKLPLQDIVALSPGSMIEFERSGDAALDLLINNAVVGTGHAVKAGENFGLRVHAIGDVSQRIRSMRSP